jgi:hypothetical protein
MDKLVSIEDAMDRLGGISRTTLAQLRVNGTFTERRIGARVFLLESEVQEFIKEKADG